MTDPVAVNVSVDGTPTTTDDSTTVSVVSPEAADSLMAALTGLISGATTPEIQQAQVLLLQRLALEGSVIPSRIPAPANITEVGGYLNLLTTLGQNDMRTQMLGAALGLAGTLPLPGLSEAAPPLGLTTVANDRPAGAGGAAVQLSVTMRTDLAPGLTQVLDAVHSAGGLLPLWSPVSLPPAGSPALQDLLLYLGRAVLVAPTAATVDPQTDPVLLGRPAADATQPFRLAVRVANGTAGADTADQSCLAFDPVSGAFVAQTVSGAAVLGLDGVLAGTGLTAAVSAVAPASRADLTWARIAALVGLVPGVSRLGDELALVYPASRVGASALATMVNWIWDGSRFAP